MGVRVPSPAPLNRYSFMKGDGQARGFESHLDMVLRVLGPPQGSIPWPFRQTCTRNSVEEYLASNQAVASSNLAGCTTYRSTTERASGDFGCVNT